MNIRHAAFALTAVALVIIPGVARANMIYQYDFLTTASIAVDGSAALTVNNATLSMIVDWTSIDNSGLMTTATGEIVSILASIPANATGFETALLNDGTISNLTPYFTTLGFGTSMVADAASELSALGTTFHSFANDISALDPFGLNPIFGGTFILGSAYEDDLTYRDRNYSFQMDADGTGGVYAFTEEVASSFFNFPLDEFGTESASISYEVGQLVTVIPEPSTMGLLGSLGAAMLCSGKTRRK